MGSCDCQGHLIVRITQGKGLPPRSRFPDACIELLNIPPTLLYPISCDHANFGVQMERVMHTHAWQYQWRLPLSGIYITADAGAANSTGREMSSCMLGLT